MRLLERCRFWNDRNVRVRCRAHSVGRKCLMIRAPQSRERVSSASAANTETQVTVQP